MTLIDQPNPAIAGYRSHMSETEFETWALRGRVPAEWVEGAVVLMSPVNIEHADIVGWLYILLGLFVSKHELGKVIATEVMVRLPERRRLPDIFYVSKERQDNFTKTYLQGPPNLVVEVVSPDSESRDWREKFLEYQDAGVEEYWIIDPASHQAEFYTLAAGKYDQAELTDAAHGSKTLPGFWFKPEWLWQNPLPNVLQTAKVIGIV